MTGNGLEVNILNIWQATPMRPTLALDILFLMTSATTPSAIFTSFHFLCFFRFLVCFNLGLLDLYMSIQSRRSSFSKKSQDRITTLILFFIMLHIYGVATANCA